MNEITKNEIDELWSRWQSDTENTVANPENVLKVVAYIRQEREKQGKLTRQTDSTPLERDDFIAKLGLAELVKDKPKTPTIKRRL